MWWQYRTTHILPRAGGYLDQPAAWWRTVRILNKRYASIFNAMKEEADTEKSERGLFGGGAESWQDMLRG